MIQKQTSRAIDVTRGIAALGVIWGHAIYGFSLPLELNGAYWVWIFLVLSGYLVAKGFEHERYGQSIPGYRRFLWNRAVRIVPLAWIALTCGIVIEAVGLGPRTGLVDVIRQFAFIPSRAGMTLSGPLWTVATEMQFYAVSLLVCWPLTKSRQRSVAWSVWFAFVCFAWVLIPVLGDNAAQPRTLVGNLPFFLCGVAIASTGDDARFTISRTAKALMVFVPTVMAWYLQNWRPDYFWGWGGRSIPFGGGALCALIVAAIVLATRVPDRTHEMPLKRALAWCGFHTYGIYVYHSILAEANSNLMNISPGVVLLLVLSVSVPLAALSYRFIEEPLLKLKRPASMHASAKPALA